MPILAKIAFVVVNATRKDEIYLYIQTIPTHTRTHSMTCEKEGLFVKMHKIYDLTAD